MLEALSLAQKAYSLAEVPVGAIIFDRNAQKVIARTYNQNITLNDPTAHAEILAIREAAQTLGTTYLTNCDLIVTLEPCPMCAQAIAIARIERLFFGAYDLKSGGVEHGARIFSASSAHHKPEIYGGILEQENRELLQRFFQALRS
ncbi:nucleoside deaminase [Rickettsiales endosymbiont of Stachyamoeba lipophora]|uniref:nucleoside deaminase n=1 Tax=Rickettsiales endosymbiont of Stachyamoeba lipophora TaxID=2486578 RepID=UPI000F64AF19|nr:nucleoside deaminase [Rickettsiales endosymbiont of Stachyamoeba lipophora]